MPSPGRAQLDPDLKIFRDLVASGVRPTQAYKRVYAPTRKISPQALYQGGLRMLNRINRLNPRPVPLKPVDKPIKKAPAQPVADQDFTSPRKLLFKRLWVAVQSDKNPEAIAAVKQLRDWLREDEQKAESANISDPAIVARHCAATLNDYANMDAAQRADYIARTISALVSCGIPRADLLAGLRPPPTTIINDLQQQPVAITAPIIDNPVIDNVLQ